ncbi:hypothetical protein Gogos_006526 [Gossypium gossypioides]|uniref:S-antigen protein n=1 Tax=Gossypium gossypioides TaxID=34282 RepID=A0A7J9C5W5_GOSGO|nr:hypothetical protein [Gossypium gossypioides]
MSTQPQQPVVVLPNTVPGQAPPSHNHSDGSFGTVFIVLAVIIVISAIACFLGRLCNRGKNQTKPSDHNLNFGPKERDVELGFDGRVPAAKPGEHDGDPSKGFKMPGNGDHRDPTEIRMPGNGDPTGIGMPGNGAPTGIRIPGNRDPTRIRIPGNRGPTEFRMAGRKPGDDGTLKPDA